MFVQLSALDENHSYKKSYIYLCSATLVLNFRTVSVHLPLCSGLHSSNDNHSCLNRPYFERIQVKPQLWNTEVGRLNYVIATWAVHRHKTNTMDRGR